MTRRSPPTPTELSPCGTAGSYPMNSTRKSGGLPVRPSQHEPDWRAASGDDRPGRSLAVLGASIKTALRSLSAHRLRSTLTVLGIVIGVAAVIVMVAVGN